VTPKITIELPREQRKMSSGSRFGSLIRRALKTGTLVIADQALFSAAGFLSTLLLARLMSAASFGIFSTIQSLSQITMGVHSSLVLEPMSVLGRSRFDRSPARYERTVTIIHAVLSVALGLLMVPVLFIVLGGHADERLWLIALVVVLCHPFVLGVWLARRRCYNVRRIRTAATISAFYAIAVPGALFLVARLGWLTIESAWGVTAVCGAIASAPVFRAMLKPAPPAEPALDEMRVVAGHWNFGRWDLISMVVLLIAQQLPVLVMTRLHGPASAGAFRVVNMMILPVALIMAPIASAILPAVVGAEARGDRRQATAITFLLSGGLTAIAVVYLIAAYFLSLPVLELLYGTKYTNIAWLVPVLAIGTVAAAATAGFAVLMRAIQRPQLNALSSASTLVVSGIATAALIPPMGIAGAVYTTTLVNVVFAGTKMMVYAWWRRREQAAVPAAA
jgi:O-antigen/teichoic acid export membrane protein